MEPALSRQELQAHHCWFTVDVVPRDPAMTAFKRSARLRQALWREQRQLPIGGHRGRNGERVTSGSRIDLAHARTHGSNFLSMKVLATVDHRLSNPQANEMLDEDRLWSDLLSSMPMCFNLFGGVWNDYRDATAAVQAIAPDAPRPVTDVIFEWSPGRLDPHYLGNKSAFDLAFVLGTGRAKNGVLGVETKYHEHTKVESIPGPARLPRYLEVTRRSGAFRPGAPEHIVGTDLQQVWLDHLLVLSMLQHPSRRWSWGRFVLIYPAGNVSFGQAAARYADQLADTTTFSAVTLEDVLEGAGPNLGEHIDDFLERYLL